MSIKPYPKYKDSGVEWLGMVPEHWVVTALKRGFSVTLGKMLQPNKGDPDDELLPYLRAANIQWQGVDTSDIKLMWLSKRDREQLGLVAGDLLVSEGGDVGRSCIWHAELDTCYFQNSVNRLRAREENLTHYLCYWMSVIKDKGYIDVLCNKSTIAHFTAEKVAAVPVPFPPPNEQSAIASFLDHETAKIDVLIAEQEKLIELLKEKRSAVISHAVTKGLNPDVKMKDSGVEWLGMVPEYWEVWRIKHLGTTITGGTPKTDEPDYWIDGNVPWLPSGKVQNNSIHKEDADTFITKRALAESAAKLIRPGSALIALTGATCANAAFLTFESTANQSVVGIEPKLNADGRFIYYSLLSQRKQVLTHKSGGAQGGINQEDVRNLVITAPEKAEQSAIASFLDHETSKIDALTTEAQHAIDLLQERRSALISAAVTGQIDVRDFNPSKAA